MFHMKACKLIDLRLKKVSCMKIIELIVLYKTAALNIMTYDHDEDDNDDGDDDTNDDDD